MGNTAIGLFVVVVFIFVIAAITGCIGYALGYRGEKRSHVEGAYGDDTPAVKMDESGNPYQPPST